MIVGVRVAPTAANRARKLLTSVQFTHPPDCPCHSTSDSLLPLRGLRRSFATPVDKSQQKEYAFEMASSSIRFGKGCTKEVGMDVKNLGVRRVMVVTDVNVSKLHAMKQVAEALDREAVDYTIFDGAVVEPKDSSLDGPFFLCLTPQFNCYR